MANPSLRLPDNLPGEFYVDSTCIDCDTCRQLAPEVFEEQGEFSVVFHQPANPQQERAALQALLACPTSSIGTVHKSKAREVMEDFPMRIEAEVYYLGFNSEKSFGGNSYLIRHPEGNWMVDSPRFMPFLAKKLEIMGGLRYIFLTHRDDVADASKYAERFGASRIIHERDRKALNTAEEILSGEGPINFGADFTVIPTPGHTAGHCVLLYKKRYLFSGDHLWFSRRTGRLGASKSVCWYDWKDQIRSMERLKGFGIEAVLPGHGRQGFLTPEKMRIQLDALIEDMKKQSSS